MMTQAQTKTATFITPPGYADALTGALAQFKTHSFSEQDRASLLDRVDDKFIIKQDNLTDLFTQIRNEYTLLEHDGITRFQYETDYFDTDDFKFFHMHHAGKSNRLKLRIRKYLDSKQAFFEIKRKNNKGLTTKTRKQSASTSSSAIFDETFLKNASIELSCRLSNKLIVRYQRITLMHKHANQRLTIDTHLQFIDPNSDQSCEINDAAIIEIKRQRGDHLLKLSSIHQYLKQTGYRPTTFSKYCMGCLLCQITGIKHNLFKANLIALGNAFTLTMIGDPR